MPTHYEVLGIPAGASEEEVRHAYRRLVKSAHPDHAGDVVRFRQITQAYGVLSDPGRRAAYDRALRPTTTSASPPPLLPPPPLQRPRYGRYAVVAVVMAVLGGIGWLVVATARQSVGDDCLIGRWRGEAFEVQFRGFLDGREVEAPIQGGAGTVLVVSDDGTVRADFTGSAPLTGADGVYRIEGRYGGTTRERWRAAEEELEQTVTATSDLAFDATISGRSPDQPVVPTVLDREDAYSCSPTSLEIGPYRYSRI